MPTHAENRLKWQKSPYLLQHARNPVDWYPWGEEALERARGEDKPLLVSIGYSSCHWCHVMERESFEDEETARVMNANFVCIKVDREERPDLDSLYIKAVHAISGQAGWPLTVFATPAGVPFYGGSYFPPEDSFNMPSFKKVLAAVSRAYRTNRSRVEEITAGIEGMMRAVGEASAFALDRDARDSDEAFEGSKAFFDPVDGGFGTAPKFPHAMLLKFLLMYHARTGSAEALSMVDKTLAAMARGGIYDHLGGGFHRYSVDRGWEVPHFEKMLYDNALLAELYVGAFETTGRALYKEVALETIGYMLREMRRPSGGFYSAQDADVAGHEGAYYLWTPDEIRGALGDGADGFMRYFQVTGEGNCEGANTLRAQAHYDGAPAELRRMKKALFEARGSRRPPETDRKTITAWNGLAVVALARASSVFGMAGLLDEAKKTTDFLLSSLVSPEGRVMRYFLGARGGTKGMLEDYALLGCALLAVHGASGERRWLDEARVIAEKMKGLFYDEGSGLFFDTGLDQDRLFVCERDLYDNDVPSGSSSAADFLSGLGAALDDKGCVEMARRILMTTEGMIEDPVSHGNFLAVLERLLAGSGGASRVIA